MSDVHDIESWAVTVDYGILDGPAAANETTVYPVDYRLDAGQVVIPPCPDRFSTVWRVWRARPACRCSSAGLSRRSARC